MTEHMQPPVSEITELSDRIVLTSLIQFLRAVACGGLAGSGIFLIFSVPFGVGIVLKGEPIRGLLVAAFPFGIATAGTFAGMILVGLPVTFLLHRYHREFARGYRTLGGVAGFALFMLISFILEGLKIETALAGAVFSLFGMLSGAAAGHVWGKWREQQANVAELSGSKIYEHLPPNPFHDLIH